MTQDTTVNSKSPPELDWIAVREESMFMPPDETTQEKLIRKIRENPFVPIGCTATVGALVYGLYNFYHGRSQMSQYMMRARVLAQGFTFIAILVGMSVASRKTKSS